MRKDEYTDPKRQDLHNIGKQDIQEVPQSELLPINSVVESRGLEPDQWLITMYSYKKE